MTNNKEHNMNRKKNTADELRKQMSYTERYSPLWMTLNGLLAEAVRNSKEAQ